MTKLPSVAKWLTMTQNQVLDKFQGIPGSFTDGRDQERFVYIRGQRDDPVLLVVHADTVWNFVESGDDSRIKLKYENNIISTDNSKFEYIVSYKHKNKIKKEKASGIGIGADDRAGCYIVWMLRSLGHSILITSGEEIGCVASNRIMKSEWWQKEIAKHQFAVQFDRRGSNDIVFYDVGTKDFVSYVEKETGYTAAEGTTTDIRCLCQDICGVNISVGYYNEHTVKEILKINELEQTLKMSYQWLSKTGIPKFALDTSQLFAMPRKRMKNAYLYDDEYAWASQQSYLQHLPTESDEKLKFINPSNEMYVKCPCCQHRMLQEKWLKERFICETCGNG